MITQVQKLSCKTTEEHIDLSYLNHPVKSIYFGFGSMGNTGKVFTFDEATMYLNGVTLFEDMSPTYFHTVQGYNNSKNGVISYDTALDTPRFTRFFTYNFCLDASSYKPTGTCNFSRLDNGKLTLKNVNSDGLDYNLYAVNYNILKISQGVTGILFGN